MKTHSSYHGGIGIVGVFWITLVILKSLDKIDISWLLVLSSFIWFPLLIIVSVLVFLLVFIGMPYCIYLLIKKRRR